MKLTQANTAILDKPHLTAFVLQGVSVTTQKPPAAVVAVVAAAAAGVATDVAAEGAATVAGCGGDGEGFPGLVE
jgi:hypothetical protein